MILVDSSVWVDYFNGRKTRQTDRLHEALGREVVVVGDLILTEVLQGFVRDLDFKTAKDLLLRFDLVEMLGRDVALKSAANYRFLRRKGVTVRKTIDVIIATFCLENDIILLHDDRDFDPFEEHLGLAVA